MVLESCSKSDGHVSCTYIYTKGHTSQSGSQVDSAQLNPEMSGVYGVVGHLALAPTNFQLFGIR
jgi:hypothetical protein